MTTSTTSTGRSGAGQASGTSSPTAAAAIQSSSTDIGLGIAAIAIAVPAFFVRKHRSDHAAVHPQNAVPPYISEMAGSPLVGYVEPRQYPSFYGGGYSTYQSSEMAAG